KDEPFVRARDLFYFIMSQSRPIEQFKTNASTVLLAWHGWERTLRWVAFNKQVRPFEEHYLSDKLSPESNAYELAVSSAMDDHAFLFGRPNSDRKQLCLMGELIWMKTKNDKLDHYW